MKNAIKKIIKDNKLEGIYAKEDYHENRCIVRLAYELERKGLISFQITEQQTDSDAWLQVDYHSNRLGKTIIWQHDAQTEFEDIEELTEYFEGIESEIKAFESQLPDLSPVAHII